MAGRRNPFEELEEMIERMSRQFEGMGRQFEGSDWGGVMGESVSIDVADHGEEFVVTADLPGFQKEDIDVSLVENTLRISGERQESMEEREGDDGNYLRRERRQQSVSRSVSLPEEVDEENVSARYMNGVLTVTLPKMHGSEEETRHIDIS